MSRTDGKGFGNGRNNYFARGGSGKIVTTIGTIHFIEKDDGGSELDEFSS